MNARLLDRTGQLALDSLSFEPEQGIIIREPERAESGYWVGAPGLYRDLATGDFLLTYRRRRPRDHRPERGHTCYIARSRDGVQFEDVWSIDKEELESSSMERFCLRRGANDMWRLYVSYVDPVDGRWRIDAMTSTSIDGFKPDTAVPVLTATGTETEGVKDPYVVRVGPVWLLFASCAARRPMSPQQWEAAHATGDIYATGATTAPTGLATSLDGVTFDWQGEVVPVSDGWDAYQSRLNSVLPVESAYLGFYDGSADRTENYEERCGLLLSFDLQRWLRLSPRGPQFQSRHTTNSLRYLDAVAAGNEVFLYYEYSRDDGSHDLRVSRVSAAG